MAPSAWPAVFSKMRPQFQHLLEELESVYQKTECQLEERAMRFKVPASVRHPDEFDDVVTSFFGGLYCPELVREECWAEHRAYVSSMAFRLLGQDYGGQAKVRSFDLARTGNAEGLRGVLNLLLQRLLDELEKRHAQALLSQYAKTDPKTRIQDARDYMSAYGKLLPSEMTDRNGVVVLEKFLQFLGQHARTVNEMRRLMQR